MQNTHDPPKCDLPRDRPLDADEILMPRRPVPDPALTTSRAALLVSPAAYRLISMSAGEDLMDLVRDMVQGRYRWRRTRDGLLAVDGDGDPVPDLMSFRVIDDELGRRFGETVSYETLRRWWAVLFPDEPPSASSRPAARRRRLADGGGDVPPVEFLPPSAA